MSETVKSPRTVIGKVISNKMDKTVVVLIERKVRHPKYGKFTRKSTKLHAHSDENVAIGEFVRIFETKPISKTKSWKVLEVVQTSK